MATNDEVRTESPAQGAIGRDAAHLSRRRMLKGSGAALAALGLLGTAGFGNPDIAHADEVEQAISERPEAAKPRIVLVHGAWADGTGWQHIIPLLEKEGYPVIAVQNPLTSIADDVATTKRVIDAESLLGPVVVVAHSYGGVAMTGAAAGNANVKALVYLASFAPDAGEVAAAFLEQYPSLLGTALVPDAAGYFYVDRAKFREVFAGDVNRSDVRVMAAAQKPVNSHIFGESLAAAAWRTIPSWYLVSKEDNTINPDLQRFYAQRMNATTKEISASHVAFISRPKEVVRFIQKAAKAVI
ncbi:MAG: alpha/beta hydrolase [Chloroflexales bacterium]|nr:alpha/beta hydrolase [Chloroflexales bacterium]